MTDGEWQESILAIKLLAEEAGGDPFDVRNLIFGLWNAMLSAPILIQTKYSLLKTEDIESLSEVLSQKLCANEQIDPPAVGHEFILFSASLLYALEAIFIRADGSSFPRHEDELKVSFEGVDGYLLPFKPAFRESDTSSGYLQKRGLKYTRCIPSLLPGGLSVDLKLYDKLMPKEELVCTAQLFESAIPLGADGAALNFSELGEFSFAGMDFKESLSVEQRLGDACPSSDIIVFPELMMPHEQVLELQHALRSRPWDTPFETEPPFLVLGGSWHYERECGKFDNRAPLFDGFGNHLGDHVKSQPFTSGNLVENIVPSNTVLVLASPNLTVAVAICLDFCQDGHPLNPYDSLDVDLVLVPSMGGDSTIQSHLARAKQCWNNRKTATFVAQQDLSNGFGYAGCIPLCEDGGFEERVEASTMMRKINQKG